MYLFYLLFYIHIGLSLCVQLASTVEPNAIKSAKTPASFYIDAVFLVCVDGQRIAG